MVEEKLDMYKEKNPLPVVLMVVLNSKNEILLGKRKREPYAGFFGVLGGRQTFGLSTREIVKEEIMKEVGYSVLENSIKVRGFYSEILLDANGGVRDHFIFRVCEVYVDESKSRKDDIERTDLENFQWFSLPLSEEVRKKIIPSDLIFIDHVLSSNEYDFKEIVMKETKDGKSLEILNVS
jgi:ADP-ribose pyrophosphatase YjhB (NUDIX family)